MICTVDGCPRRHYAKGWCNMHWQRVRKFGSTDDPRPSLTERFWAKVDRRADDECWPWLGSITGVGYGNLKRGEKNSSAHRLAYELVVGPIPEGMTLDHLCHTNDLACSGGVACPHRRCVNPAHLEVVTLTENVLRGLAHRWAPS